MPVIEVNDSTFDKEVLKSDIPVMVQYYAHWCHPCQDMLANLETLSEEYKGKIKFCKVDHEKNPKLASEQNIPGIPRLLGYKKGQKPIRAGLSTLQEMKAKCIRLLK